ncbi:hypothetical protein N7481_003667 [Penicillium waksmanii]|uniref:uncharacterized protein n=1 Tax=Penicillium waksmanii TaxID=69791 RepID=UPI0025495B75|nr:uncharacterized protein N7481_003667 [Penicillium waksmanii]KAJ5988457.1 hypothetical protein N7481_003667 [Penicillium waksmanii]
MLKFTTPDSQRVSDYTSEESTPDAKQLQTVFRVSPREKRDKTFHARRSHKKSRGGCLTCKRRRVKCDEQKPHCQKCKCKGIECSYLPENDVVRQKRAESLFEPDDPTAIIFTLSLNDLTNKIETVLGFDSKQILNPLISKKPGPAFPTVAFQHFMNSTVKTIASPAIRKVMGSDMIRVSFALAISLNGLPQNPHLMYTVLAVGILHLNRISPNKERSFAEAYFWQQALQQYQRALSSPVRPDNVDALLSSCMMMGVMTICPEDFSPTDSWVLTNRPEAMNWLCLQSGLRTIITLAAPYIPDSIWAVSFDAIVKEERTIFDEKPQAGRDGLDPDLADLCQIDEYTTENNSIYYDPLRILSALLKLERNRPNSAHVSSFMGRLECDFLALCRKRDVPALVMLVQWMGLMCAAAEWQPWIEGRIRPECIAICMFLEHSTDPLVLRLLKFPAEASGYELTVPLNG